MLKTFEIGTVVQYFKSTIPLIISIYLAECECIV